MASPDHRELLEAIGSENSPNTMKSPESISNLSSLYFNQSVKRTNLINQEKVEND